MVQDISYWLAVAAVAVLAVAAFKWMAATPVGARVPGWTELAAFI